VVFDAGQLDKIVAKTKEFSAEIGSSSSGGGSGGGVLTDSDLAALSSLAATLAATSR